MSLDNPFAKRCFLYPSFIVILAIWIIPLIVLFGLSFLEYNLGQTENRGDFIGLENYLNSVTDNESFWNSLKVTFEFTFVALIVEILLALILAIYISDLPKKWNQYLVMILVIPIVVAPFVVGLIWNFQFNPTFGPLSIFLHDKEIMGQSNSLLDSRNALRSIIAVDVWQNTPFMTLVFFSALNGVPANIKESLSMHRVKVHTRLVHVYSHYVVPIFIVAIFLRFAGLIKTFETIHILTQGGPSNLTETFVLYLYRISFKELHFGLGSAQGLLFNYLVLFIVLLIFKNVKFYRF